MPKEAPVKEAAASTSEPASTEAKTSLAARFNAKMNPEPEKKEAAAEPEKKEAAAEPEKKEPVVEKKDAATKPEKKDAATEPDVDATIQKETASMSAKDKAAFTNLRYKERDLTRQVRELAAQLEEVKKAPAAAASEPNADLEALKAQLAEREAKLAKYEGEIKSIKIEATDEFQNRVVKPRETVIGKAEVLAEKYKASLDAVEKAFRTGNSDDIAAASADMSEYDRHAFFRLVDQFQEVSEIERGMRENAASELERISKTARERQELDSKAREEEWGKAVPDVWARLQEDFPVLAHIEGDDDWNKVVDDVKEFASAGRFGALTTREQVETLYRARAFPALMAEFDTLRTEHARVTEELKKYESVPADVKNSGRDTTISEDTTIGLADRFSKLLRRKS